MFTRWILSTIFMLLFFATQSRAEVPSMMAYSGKLRMSGNGVPNKVLNIRFAIYEQAEGGTPIWMECQDVQIDQELFSVMLGQVEPLSEVVFNGERFLGIQIEGDIELSPRQQFASVGYAFRAKTVDTLPEHLETQSVTAASASVGELAVAEFGTVVDAEGRWQGLPTPVACYQAGPVQDITLFAGNKWMAASDDLKVFVPVKGKVSLDIRFDGVALTHGVAKFRLTVGRQDGVSNISGRFTPEGGEQYVSFGCSALVEVEGGVYPVSLQHLLEGSDAQLLSGVLSVRVLGR